MKLIKSGNRPPFYESINMVCCCCYAVLEITREDPILDASSVGTARPATYHVTCPDCKYINPDIFMGKSLNQAFKKEAPLL
jgi:hypothetical protein